MILLFGYRTDGAIRLTLDAAADLGVTTVLVDQTAEPLPELVLEDDQGVLHVNGVTTRLSDVGGAYLRPLAPTTGQDPGRVERGAALADGVVGWCERMPGRVASRASAMHSNSSKPYQAQLIARAGFEVPATLVTNDPDAVRDFAAEHGALVYKSTSGIRSIVRRLDAAAVARLDRVRSLPTQFQAVVDGTDVRVHVVGERVFATEVRSQAVDYRYAHRDGLDAELVATDVPDDVAQRCVRLAAELGLALAGVDLRRTPDGRWACFEVNPMPGYSFYESHTGQPISRALVAHLAGEAD